MDVYQFARNDGAPRAWSAGRRQFDRLWDHAADLLRFHRGEGFTIREHGGAASPRRRFSELHDRLVHHLDTADVEDVFEVASLLDAYSLLFRRHASALSGGEQVITREAELHGTSYVWGVTDCSWLSGEGYAAAGVTLPRTSLEQRLAPEVLAIERAQIIKGDLLFYDGHVATYLDDQFGGRVWDTQPHNTTAPWGGMQGVGVQIRSMAPGWYCQWAKVLKIGRVVAVNGPA